MNNSSKSQIYFNLPIPAEVQPDRMHCLNLARCEDATAKIMEMSERLNSFAVFGYDEYQIEFVSVFMPIELDDELVGDLYGLISNLKDAAKKTNQEIKLHLYISGDIAHEIAIENKMYIATHKPGMYIVWNYDENDELPF